MAKAPQRPGRARPPTRPKFPPTYIGPWIDHFGRTRADVAEKVGMSESQLSLVISGQRKYIQDKLEAIAQELGIERGMLFYPPGDDPNWISLDGLKDAEREAARSVVRGFRQRR